jgi:hypothetical protein
MTCDLNAGTYNFSCEHCRTRFVKSFSCKVMRKNYVEWIVKYGVTGDWKTEPNCGCKNSCEMERNKSEILHKLSTRESNRRR